MPLQGNGPRPACVVAQSDQGLHCPMTGTFNVPCKHENVSVESNGPADTLYMHNMHVPRYILSSNGPR